MTTPYDLPAWRVTARRFDRTHSVVEVRAVDEHAAGAYVSRSSIDVDEILGVEPAVRLAGLAADSPSTASEGESGPTVPENRTGAHRGNFDQVNIDVLPMRLGAGPARSKRMCAHCGETINFGEAYIWSDEVTFHYKACATAAAVEGGWK